MKEVLNENRHFFKQILKLSKSELIKTYKGAALGPAWAVIKPVITIFVYWFAFAIGLRGGKPISYNGVTVDFFPFLMVGTIPWFFMSDAILNGAGCIRCAWSHKRTFAPNHKCHAHHVFHQWL